MEGFPVRTRQHSVTIMGQPADLVFSDYADKCMLLVTQMPSMGTIQYIRLDSSLQGGSTYNITTLLGKRDDAMLTLCARRVAEQAHEAGNQKPLLLCLGLRDVEKDTIKDICAVVQEQRFWG